MPFRHLGSELVSLQLDRRCSSFAFDKVLTVTYPNLRELAIECCLTSTELAAVRPSNFPCLESLRLPTKDEFQFETLCEFKSLRSCVVMRLEVDRESRATSISLTSLFVIPFNSTKFFHLLRHLPRLVLFQTNTLIVIPSFDPSKLPTNFVHQNPLTVIILYFDPHKMSNLESVDISTIVELVLIHLSADMVRQFVMGFHGLTYEHCEQLQRLIYALRFRHFLCRLFYDWTDESLPTVVDVFDLPLFRNHRVCIDGIVSDLMISPKRMSNGNISVQ